MSLPYRLPDLAARSRLARRGPQSVVLLRILALLLAPALQPWVLAAQTLDRGELAERLRTELEEAKIAGDADALRQMVILSRRAVTAFPEDALLNHYAGYALYRLAGPTMETDLNAAYSLLEEAESFLERSVEIEPIAESYALLFSALGMRIDGPVSAMSLGMRSGAARDRAKALGPRNPRVRLLEGVSAFHTPRAFGGGHETALEHFLAAIELFAEDTPQPPLPAWGHAEAYAWLGQIHVALGQAEAARTAFERALELEPGYVWVREVLLPGLGQQLPWPKSTHPSWRLAGHPPHITDMRQGPDAGTRHPPAAPVAGRNPGGQRGAKRPLASPQRSTLRGLAGWLAGLLACLLAAKTGREPAPADALEAPAKRAKPRGECHAEGQPPGPETLSISSSTS